MPKPTNLYKDMFISLMAIAAVISFMSGELVITSTLIYLASLLSLVDFRTPVRT